MPLQNIIIKISHKYLNPISFAYYNTFNSYIYFCNNSKCNNLKTKFRDKYKLLLLGTHVAPTSHSLPITPFLAHPVPQCVHLCFPHNLYFVTNSNFSNHRQR